MVFDNFFKLSVAMSTKNLCGVLFFEQVKKSFIQRILNTFCKVVQEKLLKQCVDTQTDAQRMDDRQLANTKAHLEQIVLW